MVVLRSILFNLVFFIHSLLWFLALIPITFLPRRVLMRASKLWSRSSIFIHRVLTGARIEFRGVERIPKGPLLVISKHQSAWETIALLQFFEDPTFILKQELLSLPLFGWYLRKTKQIPIDRERGGAALLALGIKTKEAINENRQILIFPEGTRRPIDAAPEYKPGIARLYTKLNTPALLVALTSGLAWPRDSFWHYPKPIIVDFFEILPPGLPGSAFLEQVSSKIEARTQALLIEAGHPPRG
jgi:1-acyl-sn-glycerol-3-phosphate acyltransferase